VTFPLHILLLEDDPNDARLIEDLLEADQFVCRIVCVQSRAEFLAALKDYDFDLILSDYKLPSFDGLSALSVALSARTDLPFTFVSGALGEEAAIEALKVGATDYVLKTRVSRLVPAVRRALGEARNRTALQGRRGCTAPERKRASGCDRGDTCDSIYRSTRRSQRLDKPTLGEIFRVVRGRDFGTGLAICDSSRRFY
jgi:CheY-like chemotaxis protein